MKFLKKLFGRNQKKEESEQAEDPRDSNLRREIQMANEAMYYQIQKGIPQDNENFKQLVETQTLINNIIIQHTSAELINMVIAQVQMNRQTLMSQNIDPASETIQ